jgi:tetratricopeptide (TPR) repeat protein
MALLTDLVPKRTLFASFSLALLLPTTVLTYWLGPWSPAALARADRMAEEGNWSDAVERYEAIAEWSPDRETRADALYAGGAVAATAGLHSTAQNLLRRFEQNYPQDPRQDEARVRLGTVYEGLGRPVAAARAYERSLDFEPNDPGARELRAGDLWLQAERPWLAWSHWEKAAEDTDSAPQAWRRMARARLEAGDYEGADEYYVRMLESGATGEWEELARLGRAVCAEGRGDYANALAELETLDGRKTERARDRVHRRDPR